MVRFLFLKKNLDAHQIMHQGYVKFRVNHEKRETTIIITIIIKQNESYLSNKAVNQYVLIKKFLYQKIFKLSINFK